MNLDMTDSMGPGKLVRHMQNPSYTYDDYLICIGLGPSIWSVICKNPSYSGPSYPSSPVISSFWETSMSGKEHSPEIALHCLDQLKCGTDYLLSSLLGELLLSGLKLCT